MHHFDGAASLFGCAEKSGRIVAAAILERVDPDPIGHSQTRVLPITVISGR